MQFAKDSFFLTLQDRLAGLNPARTVTLNGVTVPAVVVSENLTPSFMEPKPDTFYIDWGEADVVGRQAGRGALMSLDVVISYYTTGSVASMVDRGRVLAQLDNELLNICQPPNTEKRNYTISPSADLGTSVFWGQPSFKGASRISNTEEFNQDGLVRRRVKLTMYFFSEATVS